MTGFDIAAIVLVTLSTVLGLWRGVIHEVFALAAWIAAIACAFLFGEQFAQLLPFAHDSPLLRTLAGYALVFVGVFVALSLTGFLFNRMVKAIGLSFLDRALGAVFGAVRGVLIAVILVLIAGATTMPQLAWWRDSVSAKPLSTLAAILRSKLPENLAKHIRYVAGPASGKIAVCVA